MGLLDDILGNEKNEFRQGRQSRGGNGSGTNPFEITVSLSPLRLSSHKSEYVEVTIRIRNISSDVQLVSADVFLPMASMLGFEPACINKALERRLGEMQPGEVKDARVQIWGNNQTKSGNYTIDVAVFSHYQTFDKIFSSVKRNLTLRVV